MNSIAIGRIEVSPPRHPDPTPHKCSRARTAGGSRAQIRKALDNLEMTGRVRRHRSKAGTRIELLKFK